MKRLLVPVRLAAVDPFSCCDNTTPSLFDGGGREALAGVLDMLAGTALAGASRPPPLIGSPQIGLGRIELSIADIVTTSTVAEVWRCRCPVPREYVWAS